MIYDKISRNRGIVKWNKWKDQIAMKPLPMSMIILWITFHMKNGQTI